MCALGTEMACDAMVQRALSGMLKTGGSCRADKPVKDHRNAQTARARNGPRHRCQLAAPQAAQGLHPVALPLVQFYAFRHHTRLVGKARIINARPASGPLACITADQRSSKSGGRGCVANPHLADHQQVRIQTHRVPACGKRCDYVSFGHRRPFGEILCRAVQL